MLNKLDLAAKSLRWSGGGKVLRAVSATWQGILVLNYHRIGEPNATFFDRDVFSARQDAFDQHVSFLKGNFDVILPHELPTAVASKRGRHILITFDDGYRDNFELALPVLKSHGTPATFFVCTGYIDDPRLPWWDEIAWMIRTSGQGSLPAGEWFPHDVSFDGIDRSAAIRAALRAFKRLPAERTGAYMEFLRDATDRDACSVPGADLWLTWDMIRGMSAAGMTIGAHTIRHHLLARLSEADQEIEIVGSRDRIANEVGSAPRAFAYPVGSRSAFTTATKDLLRRHGFEAAFSFYGGFQTYDSFDRFDIRRAHVGHVATQTIFEAMVTLPAAFARW